MGIGHTTFRLRQHIILPDVQHVRSTPQRLSLNRQFQWRDPGVTGHLITRLKWTCVNFNTCVLLISNCALWFGDIHMCCFNFLSQRNAYNPKRSLEIAVPNWNHSEWVNIAKICMNIYRLYVCIYNNICVHNKHRASIYIYMYQCISIYIYIFIASIVLFYFEIT